MNAILIRSLVTAGGGMAGFLVGLRRRKLRNDQYLRKALVEVVGAALAGTFLAIPTFPGQIAISFLVGLAWSHLCQWVRAKITEKIEQASESLRTWLKSAGSPGDALPADRHFAIQWPAVVWVKVLHGVGLSNLSDEQIAAYEIYRAQVAWDISHRERLNELRHWIRIRAWPLLCIAAVGYTLAVPESPTYLLMSSAGALSYGSVIVRGW